MSDRRHHTAARSLLCLSVALTAGACSDGMTAPEIEPEPAQPAVVYDLDLTTRYIKIVGTCDESFGKSRDGEFQWRYRVAGVSREFVRSTESYNSPFGENVQRGEGENINFANRSYVWRGLQFPEGAIEVTLSGAEWDGATKDDRMKNRSGTRPVVFALGTHTRSVTVGAKSNCRMRLYYDATWVRRTLD